MQEHVAVFFYKARLNPPVWWEGVALEAGFGQLLRHATPPLASVVEKYLPGALAPESSVTLAALVGRDGILRAGCLPALAGQFDIIGRVAPGCTD
jgi:hypothetical protein